MQRQHIQMYQQKAELMPPRLKGNQMARLAIPIQLITIHIPTSLLLCHQHIA